MVGQITLSPQVKQSMVISNKQHTGISGLCMQVFDTGLSTLGSGRPTPDAQPRMPNPRHSMPDAGPRIQDPKHRPPAPGPRTAGPEYLTLSPTASEENHNPVSDSA